jgi:hypothetical protein
MLVVVVIARENFDSGHFELFNFPGRWLLRPAFLAGIQPCDVIMHKVYFLAKRIFDIFNCAIYFAKITHHVKILRFLYNSRRREIKKTNIVVTI